MSFVGLVGARVAAATRTCVGRLWIACVLTLPSFVPGLGLAQGEVYRRNMSVNFVDVTNETPAPNIKAFRRYGTGPGGIPNVMDLHCAKVPGALSQMVFRLPADLTLRSFPRDSHDIKIAINVATDRGSQYRFVGTYYRMGEIFIDRTPDMKEAFDEVLSANRIELTFGRQNDRIEFAMDVRVDLLIAGMIMNPAFQQQMGYFRQMRPQEVVDRCAELSPVRERLALQETDAPVRCGEEMMRGTVCRTANRLFIWCKSESDLREAEAAMRSMSVAEHQRTLESRRDRCGTTTAVLMNVMGTPENTWDGEALHPAVSRQRFIAPVPVSGSLVSASVARGPGDETPRTPDANLLAYGSRIGMNLTVIERRGIGTANARIRVVHTEANARAFCVEYLDDHTDRCMRQTMREVRPRSELTANCRTGVFTDPFGGRFQFRGKNRTVSPEYRIFSLTRNEDLDGSNASGYYVVLEQFKALCGIP